MRIALISTPFVPVPPVRYGGTELVVFELFCGLRASGHQVMLFTVGDEAPRRGIRALYRTPVWPPEPHHEASHAAWALGQIADDPEGCDVIHAHVPSALPLFRFATAPLVYTFHHPRDPALTTLYQMHERAATIVAVSDRQRQLLPEISHLTRVHHGLDPGRYPLGDGKGPALFLGRLAREKGPHVAIDVARSAGAPLVVAGDAHWCDRDYFAREVEPRLDFDGVTWIGEVGLDEKGALLGHARALLFPIDWEEPFGLVMIEAMLSGTPVLGFPRGAVPEVIEPGVTGFICRDEAEMAARLVEIARGGFDRARCRARAIVRFGRARMVADYLDVYRAAILGEALEGGRAVVD